MIWLKLILACLALHFNQIHCQACFDPSLKHSHGSKTTYTNAYQYINCCQETVDTIIPNECSPEMIFLINRHAIRYPSAKQIKSLNITLVQLRDTILRNYNLKLTHLSNQVVAELSKWNLHMSVQDDYRISLSGFKEIHQIGPFHFSFCIFLTFFIKIFNVYLPLQLQGGLKNIQIL